MASLFLNFLRRQIDSRPSDYDVQHIKPINTLPPVHASFTVFCLLALLVVPSFAVASWTIENTFFSTTAFSWEAFGDLVLPLGAGIFAAAVSAFRNPMHSLLSLLGVFFCTALLYLVAGIAFVGVVFLIVYVGAVAVLFLFVIMLLNVKSLTSDEPLVRHMSQILAIVGVSFLLLQLHFVLTGSLEHAFAIGFLREIILEPTTSEAVIFFVRFQAMDINGLTGLYTTHGILLMVTTAILLVALLGAIILATVTTERATSISDLRRYSQQVAPLAAVLSFSFFVLAAPITELETVLTLISPTDIDPIFLSFYYEKAERDRELRTIRVLKQDTYVPHNLQFSTRRRPLPRLFLNAKFAYRRKQLRKAFGTDKEEICLQRYERIYNRKLTAGEGFDLERSDAVYGVYVAQAALAPVLARRYRDLTAMRIMRRRWLWRWRRNRAAWLRRLTIKEAKIREDAEEEDKEKYYPRYPNRNKYAEVEYKYTFFRRIIVRLRPVFRLFGKRRISLSAFLHLILVTKVYALIFYWAGRIRAFCSYFMFFVFFLPSVITLVWFFVEEQVVVRDALIDIHAFTSQLLYDYTDLKHISKDFSVVAAALIIFPATVYATIVLHPWLLLGSALVFAWDAMTSHGGELSDAEFQESRCNYWRKYADDYHAQKVAWNETTFLGRTKTHPDKGRSDGFLVIAAIDTDRIVAALKWLFIKFLEVCVQVHQFISFLIHYFRLHDVYRCLSGMLRIVWGALKAVPPMLLEKFPFLTDWYAVASSELLIAITWLLACLRQICEVAWLYICRGFYAIEYRPRLLDSVGQHSISEAIAYSILVLPLILVTVLYFIATFMLLVPWQRVYQGVPVRRPSAPLYVSLFVVALYISGVLAQKFTPVRYLSMFDSEYVSLEVYTLYIASQIHDATALAEMYPYQACVGLGLIINFFYRLVQRRVSRQHTLSGEALVFRNYYNYWLRCMSRYERALHKSVAERLAPFSSTQEAYAAISQEAKAELDTADAEEIAQSRRMIWIRVKNVPKYYDPHPDVKYRKHRWAYAYVVENHYKNPHHSA